MEEKEFKEHIKEIARLELKNSFTDNLMQTLNSSFIFQYVQTLEEENQQLEDKLKKIDNQAKTQISIIKSQPSPNKEADDYFVARLETISKIIKGDEE